jgi:hypothetical protein
MQLTESRPNGIKCAKFPIWEIISWCIIKQRHSCAQNMSDPKPGGQEASRMSISRTEARKFNDAT